MTCENEKVGDLLSCEAILVDYACLIIKQFDSFVRRVTKDPITKEFQHLEKPLICEINSNIAPNS